MSDNWAVNMKVQRIIADTTIFTGGGYYFGCRVNSDGTNVGTAAVYDNTSAAGTIIDQVAVPALTFATEGTMFDHGVRFNTGLFIDVTTPLSVIVWYIPTGA